MAGKRDSWEGIATSPGLSVTPEQPASSAAKYRFAKQRVLVPPPPYNSTEHTYLKNSLAESPPMCNNFASGLRLGAGTGALVSVGHSDGERGRQSRAQCNCEAGTCIRQRVAEAFGDTIAQLSDACSQLLLAARGARRAVDTAHAARVMMRVCHGRLAKRVETKRCTRAMWDSGWHPLVKGSKVAATESYRPATLASWCSVSCICAQYVAAASRLFRAMHTFMYERVELASLTPAPPSMEPMFAPAARARSPA